MADLATLLMAQPSRRRDPLSQQRKFADMLMQQGSSTAPVRHPLEGLARALQGGLSGYMMGDANRQDKERETRTTDKLGRMLAAKSTDEIAAIAKEDGGDMDLIGPIMGQLVTQKMADERKTALGTAKFNAMGLPGVPPATGAPAAPGMPSGEGGPVINMTPLPSQSTAPGAFANNVGNLRASNASWEGKGAPQNGFETFATPQQGVNAAFQNLGAYVKQNPNITVAQAIAKWAPPNENDTQTYISQVAEATGINPGMPLAEVLKDPAVAAQMLDAITRKEKGGLPQGVNADTFMAATGGQPQGFQPTTMSAAQIPDGLTQMPAQGAEGVPQPQAAPQAPQAPQQPQIAPQAAALEQQAMQAFQGGDIERAVALRQKAQEAQAAYVGERAKVTDTRSYEAAEYDRREKNKPATKDQSDAAGFADRMTNSFRILGQNEQEGLSTKGRALDSKVFGVGIPGANYGQSEGYQKFRQAKDDFINAQLRRESGAVISDSEYAAADRQYFPQPGDKPDVVKQKLKNRQLAVEAMTRAAGPNYTINPTVNKPPAGGDAGTGNVPAGAVEMLKADPSLRDAFDQKYGQGAAARVLGQ